MSLMGHELELGGRRWAVASVVREGPEWRILLRGTDDPKATLTTRHEGVTPPGSVGELRSALSRPESRTFVDERGDRWKVEVIPRMESGRRVGDDLSFSAAMTSQRLRVRHDTVTSIAVVTDGELRKSLNWALSAQPA